MEQKKSCFRITLIGMAAMLAVPYVHAEPSRGFILERGTVADLGEASVDLRTGSVDTSGGVRLGLPRSELVLNSSLEGGSRNDIALKWNFGTLNLGTSAPLQTAGYVGLSHFDLEGTDSETNFVVGGAFTMEWSDFLLNFNPSLMVADDDRDANIINLGVGAHLKLARISFGEFQPGVEFVYVNGGDFDDNLLSLGTRWIYNDRLTLDFSIVTNGARDLTSIPGVIRLNAAF